VSSKHIAILRGRTRALEVGNEPRVLGMPSRTGVLKYLGGHLKSFKLFKTQHNVLKRLASAVQLRPWPPCFLTTEHCSFRRFGPIWSQLYA
jgi:hypothetical protein